MDPAQAIELLERPDPLACPDEKLALELLAFCHRYIADHHAQMADRFHERALERWKARTEVVTERLPVARQTAAFLISLAREGVEQAASLRREAARLRREAARTRQLPR